MKTECQTLRKWMSESIDGRLDAGRQRRLNAHLDQCEACRREAATLRNTVALLRCLPPEPVPTSLAGRIRERMADQRRPVRTAGTWLYHPLLRMAAAASLLAGLGYYGFIRDTRRHTLPESATGPVSVLSESEDTVTEMDAAELLSDESPPMPAPLTAPAPRRPAPQEETSPLWNAPPPPETPGLHVGASADQRTQRVSGLHAARTRGLDIDAPAADRLEGAAGAREPELSRRANATDLVLRQRGVSQASAMAALRNVLDHKAADEIEFKELPRHRRDQALVSGKAEPVELPEPEDAAAASQVLNLRIRADQVPLLLAELARAGTLVVDSDSRRRVRPHQLAEIASPETPEYVDVILYLE